MVTVEAIAVAAATLILVVTRPWGLSEGISAIAGAAVILILQLVSPLSALRLELSNWNIFLFFLGMMTVAALADQSGVFDVVAATVARVARGQVMLLYIAIFAVGAIISTLFANDSAALVLTPIVYALVSRLALDPLPFVFATTFIADTASVGLPVSNPLNVILADAFHLDLASYLGHLWLPALLVIAINLLVFLVLFRRDIRGRFSQPTPAKKSAGLPSTFAILVVLAFAYLFASAIRFSLGIVACAGAAALALNLIRLGSLDTSRVKNEISWAIFGFIGGMFILVQALHSAGVTAALGRVLLHFSHGSSLSAIAATTIGSALGSNAINNLPMALVMVKSIQTVHVAAGIRLDLIYATIMGCDLGPNLTHLGSLATFLWLFFLRRKGLNVSAWDYLKIGVVVTPLLLAGSILGLWVTSGMG